MLTPISNIVFGISIVIVLLFGLAYFILFRSLYINKNKVIINGLDDEIILKNLDCDYIKYKNKGKTSTFVEYCNKNNKSAKRMSLVGNIIAGIIYVFLLVVLCFSLYVRAQGEQVFINNIAYYVVQTNSMETVHDNNTYIKENNLENRIYQYSFVGIDRTKEIELFDIVAFKIDDKIIIHRVINISEDGKYTMRGDANPASMLAEIELDRADIIGVYNGTQNVFLGHVVVFFQSGIGVISILASMIILFAFGIYSERIAKRYDERYLLLAKEYDEESEDIKEEVEESQNEESTLKDNSEDLVNEFDFSKRQTIKYTLYARLAMADDDLRENYQIIKNHILSYKKVKCRFNNANETYNIGRDKLFKLTVRGKKIKLNFALDPLLMDPKYHTINDSEVKSLINYPTGLKVKSKRSVKYALELIDITLVNYNLKYDETHQVDYLENIPKATKEELIAQGYITIK